MGKIIVTRDNVKKLIYDAKKALEEVDLRKGLEGEIIGIQVGDEIYYLDEKICE